MKSISELFKKHPIAVIAYLLFTILCFCTIIVSLSLKVEVVHSLKTGRPVKEAGTEVLVFVFAFIFVVINFFLGIVRNEQISFYMGLCLVIIIQTIILLNIVG